MFIKFDPNTYVIRYRAGKAVARGNGLAFHYWERNTSACAVPMTGIDADYIFSQVTKDFQTVSVQGQLTYRFTDCEKAADALNFTVNLKTKRYAEDPMPKVSKRMVNLAEVLVKTRINGMELSDALAASHHLADEVYRDLRQDSQLEEMGVSVTGFTVLNIAANNDTARALEAGTREQILRSADDALYERRNASIEQERRIKENELATSQMEIERKRDLEASRTRGELDRKKMLIEGEKGLEASKTQGELERRHMVLASEQELETAKTRGELARKQMLLDGEIDLEKKRRELADLRLENTKKEADAEAYRIRSVMEAYNALNPDVLIAIATANMEPGKLVAHAFDKMAGNADKIGTLNITPDLLGSLLGGKQ